MDEQEVKEILEHKERRDRFAMAALTGLIPLHRADPPWTRLAPVAYQIADEMIKARDA